MHRWLLGLSVAIAPLAFPAWAQESVPQIPFESVPNFLKLPADVHLGEATGVAVNSKGHVFVFTRSNSANGPAYGPTAAQLLEFTADGNALRSELDRYSIGLRELPRSAGIYGAEERLQLSLSMFKGLVAQLPREGLKRIIWISPGWPLLGGPGIQLNSSQRAPLFASIVAFATELRRSQIVVDAVNPAGSSQDVFVVYRGNMDPNSSPLDTPAVWRYSGKEALASPSVPAVEAFHKLVVESEKQLAPQP